MLKGVRSCSLSITLLTVLIRAITLQRIQTAPWHSSICIVPQERKKQQSELRITCLQDDTDIQNKGFFTEFVGMTVFLQILRANGVDMNVFQPRVDKCE